MSSPWYTVAAITTGDGSDSYAVLQGLLDDIAGQAAGASGSRTVAIPCGDVTLSHPLVVAAAKMAMIGDPSGGTRLLPTDWQGPMVVARKPRDNVTTGTSLATGEGAAMRFGQDEFNTGLSLSSVAVLGELGLLNQLSHSVFWKPLDLSARDVSPISGCGCDYGVLYHTGVRIAAFADGSISVAWNNVVHTSSPGVAVNGTTYYGLLTFDGTLGSPTVTLWWGEPGATATSLLQFTVSGTTVPQLRKGAEPWAVGFIPDGVAAGPLGGERTTDAWFDGLEWADTVRQSAAFTCPATKPVPDAHTILIINGVTDDPFVLGSLVFAGGLSRTQYIVPVQGDGDSHLLAGFVLRDIEVSRGVVIDNVILSSVRDLSVTNSWQGLVYSGVCFSAQCDTLVGACGQSALIAGTQVECSNWRGLNVQAGGIPVVMYGAVGGVINGVIGVQETQFCATYVYGTNAITLQNVQVDDETFESEVPHSVISHGGVLNVSGGLFPRVAPGPVFECVGGGSVVAIGATLQAYGSVGDAAGEIVKFYGAPSRNAAVFGCPTLVPDVDNPVVPPMTLSPHWCLYDQYGVLHVPRYDRG